MATTSRDDKVLRELQTSSSIFTFETTFSPFRSMAKTVHSSALFLVYRVKPPSALCATPFSRNISVHLVEFIIPRTGAWLLVPFVENNSNT
ncbi:hypothetical protein TNCV_2418701 [Trichonephila clavipes]|nr:hypothetical protein TNCV_2418701 [Trichonephila clavipes]